MLIEVHMFSLLIILIKNLLLQQPQCLLQFFVVEQTEQDNKVQSDLNQHGQTV